VTHRLRACLASFAALAPLAWLGTAACGSFEDPNIVIDLRVLAISASPPDQVIDIDLTAPPSPEALLAQLVPTEVCALVADPGLDRRLAWSLTVCKYDDARCDPEFPEIALASGLIDDPDRVPTPSLCATVEPTVELLVLLSQIVEDDTLRGLGGIDYAVLLRIGGEDADRALDQYATKRLRVAARIPATRAANANPAIERIDAAIDDAPAVPLVLGRCLENPTPYELSPDTKVRLRPIEPATAREVYAVPTLDGSSQTFTESLTYQWIASAGGFSSGSTGGPRDVSGNLAPLHSDYRSPPADELVGPTDVTLWIIQRDERLGVHWYEACVRVVP
jgi:hypothetical protein